jgi:hypothetical protein
LLLAIVVAAGVLVARRVPFEASVNRAPGSLYTVDSDGSTRNTFLLKIINKDPSETPVRYEIGVSGLEDAEVLASPVEIPSTESRTVPLIVRVPPTSELGRTTPLAVAVSAGEDEIVLRTTFKTGAEIGE